jgi:hypothetical protein
MRERKAQGQGTRVSFLKWRKTYPATGRGPVQTPRAAGPAFAFVDHPVRFGVVTLTGYFVAEDVQVLPVICS